MKLLIMRKYLKPNYTIGRLYVNDVFFSDTIEDTARDLAKEPKIYGKTAIPCGEYRVVMSFSEHFGRFLPELIDVPYFKAIRIHSGNTEVDTDGCIVVGKNDVVGKVTRSRHYSDKLNEMLTGLNEAIRIRIVKEGIL